MKTVFRVDGGRGRGLSLGHLSRCLALADQLSSFDLSHITFFMRNFPDGVAIVKKRGYSVTTFAIDQDNEAKILKDTTQVDALIIDLEPSRKVALPKYGESKPFCVAIGAEVAAVEGVDLSVITDLRYRANPGENHLTQKVLSGPRYCLLSTDACKVEESATVRQPKRVVVTFGGSDPNRMTEKLLPELVKIGSEEATFEIVTGPAYGDDTKLKKFISESLPNGYQVNSPENLIDKFRAASVVISSAGITAYELAAIGAPAVLVPSIKHEEETAETMAFYGCALRADLLDGKGNQQFVRQLRKLLRDDDLRARMSIAGPRLIDGKGVERVAREICEGTLKRSPQAA